MLAKALNGLLGTKAIKIETTKVLKSKCLDKDYCGILLKGKAPDSALKGVMKSLGTKYPSIQLASVDSSVLLLSNIDDHVDEFTKGVHRFVMFKKVSGGLQVANTTKGITDPGRLITSIVAFQGKDLKYPALSSFVDGVVDDSIQAKKIPSLPAVKTRTKKVEKQEREKRQRKIERKENERLKRQQGDFVKKVKEEQGKAEGEDKGKETPEQKAEREKRRRERMAEEAEKWNMMPDEEDDEDDPSDGDFEDEEEEDILDLD